ncbi:hypothetical protein FXO38_02340 [Capsicum annuum]|nr:hypothetical protein FXO37_24722 [Capsicum annuum]KAF3680360.1 hypothetical protein FXO38_02340 [Capsicum annuum]
MVMIHGEPSITWKASEVQTMILQENLQFTIMGKFSYGKPAIMELRKMIPNQCGFKGDCTIRVLDERHILIRLNQLGDYIKLLSTTTYYIKTTGRLWQMRILKWDPWFSPDVKTTISVAWISLPDLPPNFFAKEAIFLIASAVGYDEDSCWNIHPKLFEQEQKQRVEKSFEKNDVNVEGKKEGADSVEDNSHLWKLRKNKYKKDKHRHIIGEVQKEDAIQTSNAFNVLEHGEV